MKYRPLGRTGLLVSEIGFGCWGIGASPRARRPMVVDDAVSLKALDRALDLGVNFYDTSILRGWHSEACWAGVWQTPRQGHYRHQSGRSDYDTEAYSPADLRRSIEASFEDCARNVTSSRCTARPRSRR